jgi:hypothetical protein
MRNFLIDIKLSKGEINLIKRSNDLKIIFTKTPSEAKFLRQLRNKGLINNNSGLKFTTLGKNFIKDHLNENV